MIVVTVGVQSVGHAIAVCIGIGESIQVCIGCLLDFVRNAVIIAVQILIVRLGVGIRVPRLIAIAAGLDHIRDRVVVTVQIEGIQDPVFIRVRRIVDIADFHSVGNGVAVAVWVEGIGANGFFIDVAQPVAIGVVWRGNKGPVISRIHWVSLIARDLAIAILVFTAIGPTAAVRVGDQHPGRRLGIRIGHKMAGRHIRVRRGNGHARLGAIEHTVVIAVFIEHGERPVVIIIERKVRFQTVDQAIIVRISIIDGDAH